jgi:hypothetical protein
MGMRPVTFTAMVCAPSIILAGLCPVDSRKRLSSHNLYFPFDSAIDLCFPQVFYCGLGADGGIVNLFKRVRPRLGTEDGENLDVPVIVLVDRLPVAKILGGMDAAGRSVQHEVKVFGDGPNSL